MLQCSCKRYIKPVACLPWQLYSPNILPNRLRLHGRESGRNGIPSYRSADASEMFQVAIQLKNNFQSFASNHLYNFDGSLDDIYQKIK